MADNDMSISIDIFWWIWLIFNWIDVMYCKCGDNRLIETIVSLFEGTAQKGRKYQNSHQTCHSCCAADKPYICDWQNCGKRFRKKPHLDTHKNIHTGRRFPCDWPNCGKSFVRKYNLIEHRKLHSSVNPNVCEFANCGKFFSSNCTSFSYLSYSCPKSLQYSIFLASVMRY